jgi:hypothetical protein
MRRGRKSSLKGEQWIVVQDKAGELNMGENRDRILMKELIIKE